MSRGAAGPHGVVPLLHLPPPEVFLLSAARRGAEPRVQAGRHAVPAAVPPPRHAALTRPMSTRGPRPVCVLQYSRCRLTKCLCVYMCLSVFLCVCVFLSVSLCVMSFCVCLCVSLFVCVCLFYYNLIKHNVDMLFFILIKPLLKRYLKLLM